MRLRNLCLALALAAPVAASARGPMPTGGPMPMSRTGAQAAPSAAARRAIPLGAAAHEELLADMRQMLASVQGVVAGLARNDMPAVAAAAAKSGTGMMRGLPASTRAAFPPAFAQMGMASHRAFERIAEEARHGGRRALILHDLAEGLQTCDACHAAYRFAPRR